MQALGPYSVSKTALLGLTRALAPELAHNNIRVNCVAPGVIKTRFSTAVKRPIFSFPFIFIHGMTVLIHLHIISLKTQLWENEDILDEFKKQLSIKRYDKHVS